MNLRGVVTDDSTVAKFKKLSDENKKKAIDLRLSGKAYHRISDELQIPYRDITEFFQGLSKGGSNPVRVSELY